MRQLTAFVFGLFLIALIGLALFAQSQMQPVRKMNSDLVEPVVFSVASGSSIQRVAEQLERRGLIRNAFVFRAYLRLQGAKLSPKAGEYRVSAQMKASEIAQILASGKSIEQFITIPEGYNRFEIGELVQKLGLGTRQEFVEKTNSGARVEALLGFSAPSLEGFLFPDTYSVTKVAGVDGLIEQMLRRFQVQFNEVKQTSSMGESLSDLEWVTLASIVEKETGAKFERPTISAVFHNRLRKGMRLQTDPTVVYGMWLRDGTWDGKIGRADLLRPTPYNTYTRSGLPPGPIANPGREALLAARQPNNSHALYFVSRNDGTHIFSSTLAQHNKAVREFQLNPKAREGKSWRNLRQ